MEKAIDLRSIRSLFEPVELEGRGFPHLRLRERDRRSLLAAQGGSLCKADRVFFFFFFSRFAAAIGPFSLTLRARNPFFASC